MKAFTLALVAITLSLASLNVPVSGDESPRDTIGVTGRGAVNAVPDMASFSVAVVTQADTASAALGQNSANAAKLLETLQKQGIAEKDLQTSRLDVAPIYGNQRNNEPPRITGYQATNQVSVTVRKLTGLGALLDAAVEAGGNQLSGISFDIQNKDELMNAARKQAIEDARHRAETFAAAANVAVGPVTSIQEMQTGYPQPMMNARAFAVADAPIATGEQEISVQVSVTYLLRPLTR